MKIKRNDIKDWEWIHLGIQFNVHEQEKQSQRERKCNNLWNVR